MLRRLPLKPIGPLYAVGAAEGLMGVIIDRMLDLGGDIEGVMPSFMKEIS
ncbi:hypothetical protein MASR1M46_12820 [Bacteroidales bacterium]